MPKKEGYNKLLGREFKGETYFTFTVPKAFANQFQSGTPFRWSSHEKSITFIKSGAHI